MLNRSAFVRGQVVQMARNIMEHVPRIVSYVASAPGRLPVQLLLEMVLPLPTDVSQVARMLDARLTRLQAQRESQVMCQSG